MVTAPTQREGQRFCRRHADADPRVGARADAHRHASEPQWPQSTTAQQFRRPGENLATVHKPFRQKQFPKALVVLEERQAGARAAGFQGQKVHIR